MSGDRTPTPWRALLLAFVLSVAVLAVSYLAGADLP